MAWPDGREGDLYFDVEISPGVGLGGEPLVVESDIIHGS
jgi:hypothetical protein